MLSVSQAAEELGVSASRVRAMIKDGVLPAHKVGNAWNIPHEAVIQRKLTRHPGGRPRKNTCEYAVVSIPDAQNEKARIHHLYRECSETFGHLHDAHLTCDLEDEEERAFCLALEDFFLQRKQRELVAKGVF